MFSDSGEKMFPKEKREAGDKIATDGAERITSRRLIRLPRHLWRDKIRIIQFTPVGFLGYFSGGRSVCRTGRPVFRR